MDLRISNFALDHYTVNNERTTVSLRYFKPDTEDEQAPDAEEDTHLVTLIPGRVSFVRPAAAYPVLTYIFID
jgi:hypothetical protein